MKNKLFTIILLLSLILPLTASVPKLQSRVNDYAGIIEDKTESDLKALFKRAEDKTGAQIAVLTVKSLNGMTIEDFSIRTVEEWKLGQKGKDNGVLFLIAPNQRKVRIEVGYGLEPMLTDLKCSYIINKITIPWFRKNNFSTGILQGAMAISGIVTNEKQIKPSELEKYREHRASDNSEDEDIASIIFILIFIFFSIVKWFVRRKNGGSNYSGSSFWGSSSWSGGGGSSWGGGGFSGGGGSFGGGGSSGGW